MGEGGDVDSSTLHLYAIGGFNVVARKTQRDIFEGQTREKRTNVKYRKKWKGMNTKGKGKG